MPSEWMTFLNSNFTTGLAGAAFGGLAGAWAAQKIAKRENERKQWAEEINRINAAIALSIAINNAFVSFKRQFVIPTNEDFDRIKEKHAEYIARREAGEIQRGEPFHFDPELQMMQPVTTPINELKEIVYSKINARVAALSLVSLLDQSIANVSLILHQRNEILNEFRTNADGGRNVAQMFLGLPRDDGNTDARYPITVQAVKTQVDDAIVFSGEIAKELLSYALKVAERYGNEHPEIFKIDRRKLDQLGVKPDMAEYEELLQRIRGFGE